MKIIYKDWLAHRTTCHPFVDFRISENKTLSFNYIPSHSICNIEVINKYWKVFILDFIDKLLYGFSVEVFPGANFIFL